MTDPALVYLDTPIARTLIQRAREMGLDVYCDDNGLLSFRSPQQRFVDEEIGVPDERGRIPDAAGAAGEDL